MDSDPFFSIAGSLNEMSTERASGISPVRNSGGIAFNIKARSLRMGDFSREEVCSLLAQHTQEKGQEFRAEATERV